MKKALFIILFGFLSTALQAQQKSIRASYMLGKWIYAKHCMTCHQADGSGAQNMIPPLIKTEFVLGSKTTLINIVLNGLNGEIKVNGDIYAGEMPPQAVLKNSEIAAVLTYVRKSFGNNASRVTMSDVKKMRAANRK